LSTQHVQCWGNNSSGQLGDTSNAQSNGPVDVFGISTATAITVGYQSACAVLVNGHVQCWGANFSGQLGDGSFSDRNAPVDVGINTAIGVSAGYDHMCALLTGGTAKCWGYNGDGELGTGNTADSTRPVQVVGLTGATSISAAIAHSCARVSNGTVKCWGGNADGELGTGATNSKVSVAVSSLSGVRQPTAATTVPWAPANSSVTAGVKKVTLAWTAASNGGKPITDYVVQFSNNAGTTWTTFNDGVHATTGATVTGLATGKSYVFRVAAKNANGLGSYGAASAAVKVK